MRRIPSFDPSQPVVASNAYINIGAADPGSKILLYNESPYNIDLDFMNGNTPILHAWEARYWTLDGDQAQIGWLVDSALNVTTPPISLVMGELYGANEKIEGSYPMALIRQASVGNEVTTNTSNSQTLTNTGNPAGTNVVTMNSTSSVGSTFTLTNDGLLALAVTIAGALQTVLQSFEPASGGTILKEGAASYLTEQLGNLQVDGTLTAKGAVSLASVSVLTHILGSLTVDNTSTFTGVASFTATPQFASKILQDGSGNNLVDWSSGVSLWSGQSTKGRFNYGQTIGTSDWWTTAIGTTGVTVTASGTVNHNVKVSGSGATPDNAFVNPYNGTPPGSQTIGMGSFTTTTANVTLGASLQALIHFWKH